MAMPINNNIPSLTAQKNLTATNNAMKTTLTRLSSGLRINSAADDAAGMAISNGLTAQIKGLNQAVRNSGDGMSLLATAEGAMIEQGNVLQRLRELAVQSANDTVSGVNRKSLNAEATQQKNELDRIAKTMKFNGINLLDGTFTAKELQVGANSGANERLTIDIQGTRAIDLGSAYKLTGTAAATDNAAWADGEVTITADGKTTNISATTKDGVSVAGDTYSALAKANAINAKTNATNVSASARTDRAGTATAAAGTINGTNGMTINGVAVGTVTVTAGEAGTQAGAAKIATAINAIATQTGVSATVNSSNQVELLAADGRNVTVATTGDNSAAATAGIAAGTTQGKLTIKSASGFTLGGAKATAASIGTGAFGAANQDTSENVSSIDLTSKESANIAIGIIDVALENLNTGRSSIGALTNRLTTTIGNLSSAVENASASNSRIVDADFAAETATMSKNSILQQAGVAILGQANQQPQLVLSLLR